MHLSPTEATLRFLVSVMFVAQFSIASAQTKIDMEELSKTETAGELAEVLNQKDLGYALSAIRFAPSIACQAHVFSLVSSIVGNTSAEQFSLSAELSANRRMKIRSIGVLGKFGKGQPSDIEFLLGVLDEPNSTDELADSLYSLGYFQDSNLVNIIQSYVTYSDPLVSEMALLALFLSKSNSVLNEIAENASIEQWKRESAERWLSQNVEEYLGGCDCLEWER